MLNLLFESLLRFLFNYDNSKFTIFIDETLYNYLKKIPRFPFSIERGS